MFIGLKGVKGARLIFNVDHIRAFQEITSESKYAEYLASGAQTMVQLDDKLVPVKESIISERLIGGAYVIFNNNYSSS